MLPLGLCVLLTLVCPPARAGDMELLVKGNTSLAMDLYEFVDVNEEGTEAAAATAVVLMELSVGSQPAPPVVFRADHPFIFLIRENSTGSILFMGRVMDPSS
jgi:serine protease inhibitor